MYFLTILFIASISGALVGFKKPWLGGIAGLLAAPLLFVSGISNTEIAFMIKVLVLLPAGVISGFISSIIVSGLRGGGRAFGQTYMSGFGAHHPGGIILSDEELRILKDKCIHRIEILSY